MPSRKVKISQESPVDIQEAPKVQEPKAEPKAPEVQAQTVTCKSGKVMDKAKYDRMVENLAKARLLRKPKAIDMEVKSA